MLSLKYDHKNKIICATSSLQIFEIEYLWIHLTQGSSGEKTLLNNQSLN